LGGDVGRGGAAVVLEDVPGDCHFDWDVGILGVPLCWC
jgi:hypothetical protein